MSKLVQDYLTNNLKRNGANILFTEGERSLTHAGLEKESNQFSNYLNSLGVVRHDRIALLMDSSIASIIAVVAILKKRAIYVPLPLTNNLITLQQIIEDIGCRFIIADQKYHDILNQLNILNKKILINSEKTNDDFFKSKSFSEDLAFTEKCISKDLIYITYTSGTSGSPKGVMMSHAQITPFIDCVIDRFNHSNCTRTLSMTPLSFDPYLTEIVPSFISGGQIIIYKRVKSLREFLKTLQDEKITNFGCGPSLLTLLFSNSELVNEFSLPNLSEIYFGYESCPVKVIRELQEMLPNVSFINGYGTTETFGSSTFFEVPNLKNLSMENIPLGTPIDGTELLILNDDCEEVAIGEIGELVIRGNTITNGYWKKDEETKRVIRKNPLFVTSNEEVYFTGDLVIQNADSHTFFVGRKDQQVKIAGYRVELMDVERIVERHPLVIECGVIAVEVDGVKRLVCYLNTKNCSDSEIAEIKKYCQTSMESYKMPTEWFLLQDIPRNSNSKVDRNKLRVVYTESLKARLGLMQK